MQRYEKFLKWRGFFWRRYFKKLEKLEELEELGKLKKLRNNSLAAYWAGLHWGRAWHLARPLLYYILIILN